MEFLDLVLVAHINNEPTVFVLTESPDEATDILGIFTERQKADAAFADRLADLRSHASTSDWTVGDLGLRVREVPLNAMNPEGF